MTQQDVADAVGSNFHQIAKIEQRGDSIPRNVQEIAEAVGVPPAWLAFGKADLDQLSQEAIDIGLEWDSLSPEAQKAVKATISALKK